MAEKYTIQVVDDLTDKEVLEAGQVLKETPFLLRKRGSIASAITIATGRTVFAVEGSEFNAKFTERIQNLLTTTG